ncbi:sensor histidine kinase [Nonomuraea sediminis]|uniref:sensor histidine kinase n=1 Tax=Nonomuraea sediminis TaxID=2835864 RepID=UPI001BDD5CBB|nr:ATP-binding protein [Nonomuraea sediminis]
MRTVRFRLTLVYSVLFLATGILLVALIYLLAAHLPAAAPPAPDLSGSPITVPETWMDRQREADLNRLLAGSAIALGVMACASVGFGWVMAGRVLRPLAGMTATVRRISADRLDRRLAATGPDDELKELSDTFDDLLGRLEAAFAAQRRFVANASHELRTPLTLQQAMVEVALADPDPDVTTMRATFERLLASCGHQERLIDALLTLARGQQGLSTRHDVDLAAIAAQVAGHSPDLVPTVVSGDAALIERLVTNLVDNARRYNVPGGWVRVSTRDRSLTVVNSGPPVPADQIAGLFQPFRRLDADRRAGADGLGLGLSIVAAIADAHAATVSAFPGPEGGLSITVTFPSAPVRPAVPFVGARPR